VEIGVWPKGVGRISVTDDVSLAIMPTISNGLDDKGYTAVVTANLPGFKNQKLWVLANNGTSDLVLSPDAAAGNGCMYVSQSSTAGGPDSPGILGATFTENPSASSSCRVRFVSHNSIPTGQNGGLDGITSWAPAN